MHRNNRLWLSSLKKKYPKFFSHARVLELGSGDTTGEFAIRSYFKHCNYLGVDIVGKEHGVFGVDVISNAKDTMFKKRHFDTLVCFSMFEHDPTWRKSLSHNIQFLKQGAMIFISFGSDGNKRHDPEPWGQVKCKDFVKFTLSLPIDIIDAFFEEERYGYDCAGVFNVIAQVKRSKNKSVRKFTSSMIRQVPPRSPFRVFGEGLLYYAIRMRRNVRNATHFKEKYFYSQ